MRYSKDGTQMEIPGNPIKTKRILVYPNITFSKDLEQDSYVQVMKKLIFELSKVRDDLYWYIISPEKIKGLQFDNVYQQLAYRRGITETDARRVDTDRAIRGEHDIITRQAREDMTRAIQRLQLAERRLVAVQDAPNTSENIFKASD